MERLRHGQSVAEPYERRMLRCMRSDFGQSRSARNVSSITETFSTCVVFIAYFYGNSPAFDGNCPAPNIVFPANMEVVCNVLATGHSLRLRFAARVSTLVLIHCADSVATCYRLVGMSVVLHLATGVDWTMSKEPSPPAQGDETQPEASTSGSKPASQAQTASKDGSNSQNVQHGNADDIAGGQNGESEAAKEDKNETPEELRQELESLRRELAAQLQKKHSLDRQLVCLRVIRDK